MNGGKHLLGETKETITSCEQLRKFIKDLKGPMGVPAFGEWLKLLVLLLGRGKWRK
jgi:hypothetical protein